MSRDAAYPQCFELVPALALALRGGRYEQKRRQKGLGIKGFQEGAKRCITSPNLKQTLGPLISECEENIRSTWSTERKGGGRRRGFDTFGRMIAACSAALEPDVLGKVIRHKEQNGHSQHQLARHVTCCFQLIFTNGRSQP